jgi:hypothetical protein
LRKTGSFEPSQRLGVTRQRQPTELLLLLRNAVRFPRVVKAKKG